MLKRVRQRILSKILFEEICKKPELDRLDQFWFIQKPTLLNDHFDGFLFPKLWIVLLEVIYFLNLTFYH